MSSQHGCGRFVALAAYATLAALAAYATLAALAACGTAAAQDAAGQAAFNNECGFCHNLGPGGPPAEGPPLGTVFGRRAGTYPGFKYTPDFLQSAVVWNRQTLDAYLTKPTAVIADSAMNYAQPDAAIRRQVIEFLQQEAKPPQPKG